MTDADAPYADASILDDDGLEGRPGPARPRRQAGELKHENGEQSGTYDSPENWPPVAQMTLDATIWPVPGRAAGEITVRHHLRWRGPGDDVRLIRGVAQPAAVSGPCDTEEAAQRAVDAYIATYFPGR